MPNLLHGNASIQGDQSVSRSLSQRAAARWRIANLDGTVTYRDLAEDPPPHLGPDAVAARYIPADQRTEAQAAAYALSEELIGEVKAADAVVLGLPLYNYAPPSTVKSWIDHLVFPGLSVDPDTSEGLLGGRRFVVVAARGGGYAEGTPRHRWDHAEPWLPHALSLLGLEPEFITAELTLAGTVPAMASLVGLASESFAAAQAAIDALWEPIRAVA